MNDPGSSVTADVALFADEPVLDDLDKPVSVLFVCTGNVCRSPAAERLLGEALGPAVITASAGTAPTRGAPMAPQMLQLLAARGASSTGHEARVLSRRLLAGTDLVLTATLQHRAFVVELLPAVVRRTFTINEFARLLAGLDATQIAGTTPSARLRSAVLLAGRSRGRGDADDIDDPYGRADSAYKIAFLEIEAAVLQIADVVGRASSYAAQ